MQTLCMSDFMEEAPKKFFRLSLGKEVRLKSAYIIKAERLDKDENGEIKTIYASYDPKSKSGSGTEESKRKVKGTLHWVSAKHAIPVECRLYDRLFSVEEPESDKEKDFIDFVNPNSSKVVKAFAEPELAKMKPENRIQFQRIGYFFKDKDSRPGHLVYNRTITLRDTWASQKK